MAQPARWAEAEAAGHLLASYFQEVLNGRDVTQVRRLFAPGVVYHSAGAPDLKGVDALERWVRDYLDAVPDYQAKLEDLVSGPAKAVLRWSCTGTHKGTLLGIPATGRRFSLTGITIVRVADGRIVEGWVERDSLGLWRQLQPAAP